MKRKVGIIGCGAILPRHLEAIELNEEFELKAICDIQKSLVNNIAKRLNVKAFTDYKKMVSESDVNFIVIATPNSLHKEEAIYCLKNHCDILIEKPVSFLSSDIEEIDNIAKEKKRKAYCVLQVRLNPTVKIVKKVLERGLLGDIRGFSFIQRWQRPREYFSGWRGEPKIGGGTLYEVGIHYLDIIQVLIGMPKEILFSKTYITKHKKGVIEDTIYALADYGSFGGTIESTIAAEPKNLESSISILGANGYIKIGGKALNIIESANFLSNGAQNQFDVLVKNNPFAKSPNSYGSYQGSCPNHPELYKSIEDFQLSQSINGIKIIEKIYEKSEIFYS